MHTYAHSVQTTDWRQILALYDQLLAIAPRPVVALNRAIAVGEVHGPEAALAWMNSCTCLTTTPSTPPAPTCCVASDGSNKQ